MKKIIILLIVLFNVNLTFAQSPKYRPNILNNPLITTQDQIDLAILMQQYIDANLLQNYENYKWSTACFSDANFLSFRIALINDLEDWLKLHGGSKFVPFPALDTKENVPTPFQIVDQDCNSVPSNPCPTPNFSNTHIREGKYNQPNLCNMTNYNDLGKNLKGYVDLGIVYGGFEEFVCNAWWMNYAGGGKNSALPLWLAQSYLMDVHKEWECECTSTNSNTKPVDLYLKANKKTFESVRDIGYTPRIDNVLWDSPDIWVRNDALGLTTEETQNPVYSPGGTQTVKVYVRVRNKGCQNSTGTEQIKLYWSKAGTYHNWPAPWDGNPVNTPSQVIGGIIDTKAIPIIKKGGQEIIEFDWLVPTPYQFGGAEWDTDNDGINDAWHFCLLARIDATNDDDGVTIVGSDMTTILTNSNNFAQRNMSIIAPVNASIITNQQIPNNATVAIGNLYNQNQTFDFKFNNAVGVGFPSKISDEAEVTLTLADLVWTKWVNGGMQGSNIEVIDPSTQKIRITGDPAYLNNINFNSNQLSALNLSFNFLTDNQTNINQFKYIVSQIRSNDNHIVGGESYLIKKPSRSLFDADAGNNKSINQNQSVSLEGNDIGENAIYNWYDNEGNLVYTGKNLTVTPEFTKQYTLEIIALADGFKDYDKIVVNVKDKYISSISPVPVSSNMTINYKSSNSNSGYFILSNNSGFNYNYILDVNASTKIIDVSNLNTGIYQLSLVCDGVVVDTKQVTIQ